MITTVVLAAGCLVLSVAVGVVTHELLHVLVLRTAGIGCGLVLRPRGGDGNGFQTLVSGSLASVQMESVPDSCSPWWLRASAMAPLVMLVPVGAYAALIRSGAAPGSLLGSMVVIGWMACALPSPADFSIVWHTAEAREMVGETA